MISWHSSTVDTGQVRLHVQSAGQGQPIIMLHGMTDSGNCWKPFANQLATQYAVYLVDARGHGQSTHQHNRVAHVDQVEDVRALIELLRIESPIIVGHSMGAMVAYIAACSYPTHIRAVVLEDPRFRPITLDTEEQRALARQQVWQWIDALQVCSLDAVIRRCISENPTWRAAELVAWAEAKHALAPRLQWEDARNMVPWQHRISALVVPTLLITADETRGGLVSAPVAAEVRQRSSWVEIAHVRNVGHCIRREAPDAYAAMVTEFIRRHTSDRNGVPS